MASVTWELRVDMRQHAVDDGQSVLIWADHHVFEVADEAWAREQYRRYSTEQLPDHLRNPRLIRHTREVISMTHHAGKIDDETWDRITGGDHA